MRIDPCWRGAAQSTRVRPCSGEIPPGAAMSFWLQARRRTRQMTRSFASLLFLSVSLNATATFAQGPGDIIGQIESLIHSAMGKGAQARWSKLPENEYACIDQKLQER